MPSQWNVNLDGTTTVTDYSAQTTVGLPATTSTVPEPGTLSQMLLAVGIWIIFRFRPQTARQVEMNS